MANVSNDLMMPSAEQRLRAVIEASPIEARYLAEGSWLPISSAPRNTLVLIWGGGPVRFGYRDDDGQWRGRHHHPLVGIPTHWMPLPKGPHQS
jgi:hypothetical protein